MQNLMLHDLSIVVNNISTKTKFGRSYDSAITHKVRSTDGASLSIALLLFLVCAVVGSVVLAAATAASGRLAKMAEMDQRYYSVTSAAELLAEELNDIQVTVLQKKGVTEILKNGKVDKDQTVEKSNITIVSKAVSHQPNIFPDSGEDIACQIPGTEGELTNISYLSKAALSLAIGDPNNCNTTQAWEFENIEEVTLSSQKFEITHTPVADTPLTEETCAQLKTYAFCRIDRGALIINITDGETESNENHYQVRLTFEPIISTSMKSNINSEERKYEKPNEIVTRQVTVEKETNIRWKLTSMQKISDVWKD